jgi:hypothetical protein
VRANLILLKSSIRNYAKFPSTEVSQTLDPAQDKFRKKKGVKEEEEGEGAGKREEKWERRKKREKRRGRRKPYIRQAKETN